MVTISSKKIFKLTNLCKKKSRHKLSKYFLKVRFLHNFIPEKIV